MGNLKISPKMKKGIKVCELILGVKFEGSSFDDASKFLNENLSKVQGKDIRDYMEPSDKMWSCISYIQKNTEERFEGTSMKQASEFISQNLEKVRKGGSK